MILSKLPGLTMVLFAVFGCVTLAMGEPQRGIPFKMFRMADGQVGLKGPDGSVHTMSGQWAPPDLPGEDQAVVLELFRTESGRTVLRHPDGGALHVVPGSCAPAYFPTVPKDQLSGPDRAKENQPCQQEPRHDNALRLDSETYKLCMKSRGYTVRTDGERLIVNKLIMAPGEKTRDQSACVRASVADPQSRDRSPKERFCRELAITDVAGGRPDYRVIGTPEAERAYQECMKQPAE